MFCWSLFVLLVLYLLVIVLSVLLPYADSYCPVGILGIVLSVLLPYTDSYCHVGIFLPLCCLFFFRIRILIAPLVSWALCCLFFFRIRILIAPLVSFCHCVVCSSSVYGFLLPRWYLGHCVVCSSSLYGFLLPRWYLFAIVLSVLLPYTDSYCPVGILGIVLSVLLPYTDCVVCSSSVLLPVGILGIVLSVLLPYTDSYCPVGILGIVLSVLLPYTDSYCPVGILGIVLSVLLPYTDSYCPVGILGIVLSVLLPYTDSYCPVGIFLPLCCLFFFLIRIIIAPLVSWALCCLFFFLIRILIASLVSWALCCLFFFRIRILIAPLVSWALCCLFFFRIRILIAPLVSWALCCLFFFRIRILIASLVSWALCCLFFFRIRILIASLVSWALCCLFFFRMRILIAPLVSWALCCLFFFLIRIHIAPLVSFCHCVVSSSSVYEFLLPRWYLFAIVLSLFLPYADSYCPVVSWALCCLFFFLIRIIIAPLVSFCHCVVCSSSLYRFLLPRWYLLAIVLSVLLPYTDPYCPVGIFLPLCCLCFFRIPILMAPLVSFGHCVVCSSSLYGFLLPRWYLFAIVLSVLLPYTDSYCPVGIFWPLCCLFFFFIRILIAPLVSFDHCVVCSSSLYRFLWPRWYLLAIVLSVLLPYTDSYCPVGIVLPLCCLFFFLIQILIAPLVSFDHCVVCSSSLYRFLWPRWYRFAIVLSVLLPYTDSYCPVGIFWPLCCLFFFFIQILIAPLVSFDHCVVCSSSLYRFLLPRWYLLTIVLSVLLLYTDSYCPVGIFWPLCCLFFFLIQILIVPLVSFDHCVVCSSSLYRFLLPRWYLFVVVLSVLRYTDSYFPVGIFLSLCCLFFFLIQILIAPWVSFCRCVVCSSLCRFLFPRWYLQTLRLTYNSMIIYVVTILENKLKLKLIKLLKTKQWILCSVRFDLILFLVFNATFSNISAISWRLALVVEEAGVPGENHRPWANNW